MKKIALLLSAVALIAFAGCKKDNNTGGLDDLIEDGFYVAGAATGSDKLAVEYGMAAGKNEAAEQAKRDGMYEKYIYLKGGKDFELLLYQAGKKTRYSATLAAFTPEEGSDIYGEDPQMAILKGQLKTGDTAPAMKVEKDGLYHIVLDLNKAADLAFAQIIVAPVEFGVRGGMNGWGFTAFPAAQPAADGSITWTLTEQKLAAGGEFKFAYGGAWKITLDDAGKVRANTNLGEGCEAGGGNITVEKGGEYTVTLTYKLAAGDIAKSFKCTTTLTKESTTPTTMYMIGEQFGNWDWTNAGVVDMVPVYGKEGCFWAVRFFEAGKGFKFCSIKEWNGDFGKDFGGDNCTVEKEGFYTVSIDYVGKTVSIAPTKVHGFGACFDNVWNYNEPLFEPVISGNDRYLEATTKAAGELRICVETPLVAEGDWWQAEFIVLNGKIAYRGNGGDQERVNPAAGAKVKLNFNAGTGSIE